MRAVEGPTAVLVVIVTMRFLLRCSVNCSHQQPRSVGIRDSKEREEVEEEEDGAEAQFSNYVLTSRLPCSILAISIVLFLNACEVASTLYIH